MIQLKIEEKNRCKLLKKENLKNLPYLKCQVRLFCNYNAIIKELIKKSFSRNKEGKNFSIPVK